MTNDEIILYLFAAALKCTGSIRLSFPASPTGPGGSHPLHTSSAWSELKEFFRNPIISYRSPSSLPYLSYIHLHVGCVMDKIIIGQSRVAGEGGGWVGESPDAVPIYFHSSHTDAVCRGKSLQGNICNVHQFLGCYMRLEEKEVLLHLRWQ